MPDDGPRIPRHLRVLVQDWIAEGALADGWLDDPAG